MWDKILCAENIVLIIDAHASGASTEVLQSPLGFRFLIIFSYHFPLHENNLSSDWWAHSLIVPMFKDKLIFCFRQAGWKLSLQ